MNYFTGVFPHVGVGDLDRNFSQLNLNAKSQLLRDKFKMLRQGNRASQEMLHQIEGHLNAISQEQNLIRQWNHYELAYEEFISAASSEDLLGVVLSLRSRAENLDLSAQEIWSKQKLGQLEDEVRTGTANGMVREEIASLARAIYESGFCFVKNFGLKSRVLKTAIFFDVFVSVLVITLLWFFELKQIGPESAWQTLLIGCLGAAGALLRATVQLYHSQFDVDDVRMQPAMLLFRAVFGAVLALIVTLFIRLRVIDFPYLHTGAADATPFAPAALYVFAFASGFAETMSFRAAEKLVRKNLNGQETLPTEAQAGKSI